MIKRTNWTVTKWADDSYNGAEYRAPKNDLEANVTGSLIEGDSAREREHSLHAPVLDFDFPCELLETTNPGHHHLYIDRPLSWDQYKKLLDTLREINLIQDGFYQAAIKNGQTMVRKKGHFKRDAPKMSPLHTIRLNEIVDAAKGLLHDMGHVEEPEVNPTEIPF